MLHSQIPGGAVINGAGLAGGDGCVLGHAERARCSSDRDRARAAGGDGALLFDALADQGDVPAHCGDILVKLQETALSLEMDGAASTQNHITVDDQVAGGDHFDGAVAAGAGVQAAVINLQVAGVVDDDGAVGSRGA